MLTNIPKGTLADLQAQAESMNYLVKEVEGKYIAEIRRGQPTALLFLVDQSSSMSSGQLSMNGKTLNRSEAVAEALNNALAEVIGKATKDYGIGDYMDVAVLGYSGSDKVNSLWSGSLAGKEWVSLPEIHACSQKKTSIVTKTMRGGITKEQEITEHFWFEAYASGQTPMGAALRKAHDLLAEWVNRNPKSYPPTVINITDGEATDIDGQALIELALSIQQLGTEDGKALMFNCHLEGVSANSISFPHNPSQLPSNGYAKQLFEMSSLMPPRYRSEIGQLLNSSENLPYRAMSFNASVTNMVQMVEIGTRTAMTRQK